MSYTVSTDWPSNFTNICDMKIGDLGMLNSGPYAGDVVLRTYLGLINLSEPGVTWAGGILERPNRYLQVMLLKRGQKICLTVE